MTSTRPGAVRLILAGILVALSALGLSSGAFVSPWFGGWPVAGLALCLLIVLPPPWRLVAFVAESLTVGFSIAAVFELSAWLGIFGSLAVTVPAWIGAHLLSPKGEIPLDMTEPRSQVRLYSVCLGMALLVAVFLVGPGSLTLSSRELGATWIASFLASLSGYLVLLPLLFRPPTHPARGQDLEWVVQAVALLALSMAAFWPYDLHVPMFLIFPLLAWGAMRAPQSLVAIEVLVVSGIAYGISVNDGGPLHRAAEGLPSVMVSVFCYAFILSCCLTVILMILTMTLLDDAAGQARRSAATVERLLESATGTYFVALDSIGRITRFNTGAAATLGYTEHEVLGHSPRIFHRADEVARHATHFGVQPDNFMLLMLEQARTGERRDWEFIRKDQTVAIMSMQVSPVRDEATGQVLGYLTSGEDITDRHRAHHALSTALAREHAAVQRLREVDHVKQELVSNVSHELRTPITSIMGYAELLCEGELGDLSEAQNSAISRIQRNTHRLRGLVEDLLTLSRAEAGRLDIEHVPVDVVSVARDVLELLHATLRDRDLTVTSRLPHLELMVLGDAGALERVLINLLNNAIKFTRDGGTVTLAVEMTDAEVILTVADTGIGMSETDQQQLFTRFFRSESATRNAIQGTGLGLSIVHAIVAAHDGEITVFSVPDKGTTMTVNLPRHHA